MAKTKQGTSVKLTKENESSLIQAVADSKLDLLTFNKAANIAVEKGVPALRKLYVKPPTK